MPLANEVQVIAFAATRVLPPIVFGAVFRPAVKIAVVAEPCPAREIVNSAFATCPVLPCWKNPP